MAFSVEDFHDLVRLLEQRPEWRMELRRLVLTDELLELPAVVRALVEAQQRTEEQVRALVEAQRRTEQRVGQLEERVGRIEEVQQRTEERLARLEEGQARLTAAVAGLAEAQQGTETRLGQLAEAQQRTETRLGQLAEAQQRTETRLGQLAEAQQRTEQQLGELTRTVAGMSDRLGRVEGGFLELRYERHAGAYFGRLVRRARVLGPDELDRLLDEGIERGALDEDAADDVRLADLVVRGRRRGEDQDSYLVVEVSVGIGPADVERAARRAAVLSRLGSAMPVVAGEWLTPEAAALAEARAVWRILNGRLEATGTDA